MPRDTKGYTLIELIVVVVLLGLVFAFVAPRFRDAVLIDNLKSTTRKLANKIMELRNDAIQKHVDHLLKFDLEKNEYWHELAGNTAEGSELAYENNVKNLPHGVRITDIWIKDKGKQMAGEITLKLRKEGYAQQSAIHLESEDGREFTIVVSPFLPRIKVLEKYIELEDT
jgi:prepilin-type N-terminal cleavage/methylation domain-containing protein